MKTIVTKAQFAELRKVKPSAVSNWIKQGKLSAAALQGEGNRARVWVEQANADLARALDPAQQANRPLPTAQALTDAPAPPPADPSDDDVILARRRLAETEIKEHDAEAARRRNAVDEGRWVEAAEATKVWNKELAAIIDGFERFLVTNAARDIGERHGSDWKAEATRLRQLFRDHRSKVSKETEGRREQLKIAPPDDSKK